MVLLTVSGHPGSGTTTLVGNVCGRRGWSSLNGGQVFREAASERGVSVEEFSALCEAEPEVDKILDKKLLDAMQSAGGPEVVESRLCGWWAHNNEIDCIRLWLAVSEDERARRVVSREGGSVKTVSAPEARELRIFGLMRSRDIIKSIRSGVAIEPRPGISGSSSSSDTVPRQ